jgi:hypothetical protein
MKTLNAKLADYLEVEGWDIAKSHTDDLGWWADEIWELKSRWSPVGALAFVTFLVDPMWEGGRRKGQGVWAVGCSAEFPHDKAEAMRGDTLNLKASKEEIEKFVEVVGSFRKSPGNV